MPKPIIYDGRADFSGGRNTSVSPDRLNPNELIDLTNARLSNSQIGAIIKRTGNQRMHVTALQTPLLGIFQWDAPSGKQTVVIDGNGNLQYKATGIGGNFTQVVPATPFSPTLGFVDFAMYRASASGAPLKLLICDGVNLQSWDGTTVTRLTGTNGAPSARFIRECLTRAFAVDSSFLKTLYWSRTGDATYWLVGFDSDGGASLVDTLSGNSIMRLECIRGSVLIFTANTISRFTGSSALDFSMSTDTQGVSETVGIVGFRAAHRIEQVIPYLSDVGPYYAMETGITAYGVDVESDFNSADRTKLSSQVVNYHRGRREIWNVFSRVGDSHTNQNVLPYNTRLQNWAGPFVYPFGIVDLAEYIDGSGSEWIIAACDDGFVRHMDIGAKDDVLADGSGGSAYTMTAQLSPIFFPVGPGVAKGLKRFHVQANLPATTALHVQYSFDGRSYTDLGAITGLGAFSSDYRVDASDVGHRLSVKFTDASTDIPIINGLITEAYNYARPE